MGEGLPETLASLVDSLGRRGSGAAMRFFGDEGVRAVGFDELAGTARRIADGLLKSGLRPGNAVAMPAASRPEWVAACIGTLRAGGVAVPIDAQASDRTLSRILEDSGARLGFAEAEAADRLEAEGLDVFRLDGGLDRFMDESREPPGQQLPEPAPADTAVLFYTSGTTGPPKGVPLRHANIVFQLRRLAETGLISGRDRLLLPLPFHHVYPFVVGLLFPLSVGAEVIVPRAMTGPELVRALREGRATAVVGVPRLYAALLDGIEARLGGNLAARVFRPLLRGSAMVREWTGLLPGRLLFRPLHRRFGPQLRILASGGALIDPELARRLEGMGWEVAIGYGLTETSPILTVKLPGRGGLDTVGRPLDGIEVRIDPSALPESSGLHGSGEILARGPSVFSGYRNLPEETEKAFTPDGWFRTGDLGRLDNMGRLRVEGRVSTLIVLPSGKNIRPEEVEESLEAHPLIREAAVLMVDSRLSALLVPDLRTLREAGETDPDEALRQAAGEVSRRLPSYQRPTGLAMTREPLPRTRLGKLRRHLLAERYLHAQGEGETEAGPVDVTSLPEADRELLGNPTANAAWEWLTERFPGRRISPDSSPQLDLGIDSLEWLTLTMELRERTGVVLSEEAIVRVETVRDLLREVVGAGGPSGELARDPVDEPLAFLTEEQKRHLEPLGPVETVLARLAHGLVRAAFGVYFRLDVRGRDRVPVDGPFVLAPNHNSYLDAFAVAAALDFRTLSRLHFAGWSGVIGKNPVNRLVSRLGRAVPVDPARGAISSLALAASVLARCRGLVWFPEGRRSPTGKLLPFKAGIGHILDRRPVQVLPVRIEGTGEAMPVGRVLPAKTRIKVCFGHPLDPAWLEGHGKGKSRAERIASALREKVMELGRSCRET